jgi:hypothetical protein
VPPSDSPQFTQTWHFTGGPLDGLTLTLPDSYPVPSEIVWREAHAQPFHDCIYRQRLGPPVIELSNVDRPGRGLQPIQAGLPWEHWTFVFVESGESEILKVNHTWQKNMLRLMEENRRLKERLKAKDRRIK